MYGHQLVEFSLQILGVKGLILFALVQYAAATRINIIVTYIVPYGGRCTVSGLVVSMLDSRSKGPEVRALTGVIVLFLGRTVPLSTQEYK